MRIKNGARVSTPLGIGTATGKMDMDRKGKDWIFRAVILDVIPDGFTTAELWFFKNEIVPAE